MSFEFITQAKIFFTFFFIAFSTDILVEIVHLPTFVNAYTLAHYRLTPI